MDIFEPDSAGLLIIKIEFEIFPGQGINLAHIHVFGEINGNPFIRFYLIGNTKKI